MTQVDPATQYYVEITLELPQGQRDLYRLTQTLQRLELETWNETYRRRPDKRGRMRYHEATITLWINPKDYRGLCIALGKWPGKATYTTIKPRK